MINILRKTLRKNKTLFENLLSLSLLRGLDYIFPLITLPYLVRVLGPEKYGLTAFASSFVGLFIIIVNYGFNYSATRDIAINRESKEKISTIFMSVMVTKILLFLLSLGLFLGIIFSFSRFRQEIDLFLFSSLAIIGNIVFPTWFFQGMEEMKYITIFNLAAKLFFTILIFVFITSANDYIYVPLLNSLGLIFSGLFSIIFAFKSFKLRLLFPSLSEVKKQFISGWHFFVSTFFISFYTTSNNFILGLLTTNEAVGYFSGAEKIVRAIRGIITPISQATYPHLSKLFIKTKSGGLKFIKKLEYILGGGSLAVSSLLFIFAPFIVKIVLGEQYFPSVRMIKIMAILPFLIVMSNIFGVQGLFAFGESKQTSKIFIIASLFHLPAFIILTVLFSVNGSALAVVLTETLVAFLTFTYFKKLIGNKTESR